MPDLAPLSSSVLLQGDGLPDADPDASPRVAPFTARARIVAALLDAAAGAHPGAPVAGLWAGSAPELGLRTAAGGTTPTWLVDSSAVRLARAVAAHPGTRLHTRRATVWDICAGHVRIEGCAAIYLPTLATHLPPAALLALCDVLLDWLLPDGRLLVMLSSPMSPGDARVVRECLLRHTVVHVAVDADGETEPHLVLAPDPAIRRPLAT